MKFECSHRIKKSSRKAKEKLSLCLIKLHAMKKHGLNIFTIFIFDEDEWEILNPQDYGFICFV